MFTSKAADKAAAAKQAGLNAGYDQASGLYGQGRDAITTNYTEALQPYQDLYKQGNAGYGAYADATGANGQEGFGRAKANFQSSPGFDFQLNQGVDALSRAGVARGVATGNTLQDAQKFGTGLAQQDWGNYVSRLQPFMGATQNAAAGQAGVLTSEGNALNQSYGQQGNLGYQTQTGIGDAKATAAMDRNRASGQAWNAIGNVAGLAVGAAGAGMIPGIGMGMSGSMAGAPGYYGGSPATNPLLRPIGT